MPFLTVELVTGRLQDVPRPFGVELRRPHTDLKTLEESRAAWPGVPFESHYRCLVLWVLQKQAGPTVATGTSGVGGRTQLETRK